MCSRTQFGEPISIPIAFTPPRQYRIVRYFGLSNMALNFFDGERRPVDRAPERSPLSGVLRLGAGGDRLALPRTVGRLFVVGLGHQRHHRHLGRAS